VLGIVAFGQMVTIVGGGFDLSVGGTVPLGSVLYAQLLNSGMNAGTAVLIVVLIGGFLTYVSLGKPSWTPSFLDSLKNEKLLRHSAVEAYIESPAANLGTPQGVVCNGGKNIVIKKGKTFSCVASDGSKFTVLMQDGNGAYVPRAGG